MIKLSFKINNFTTTSLIYLFMAIGLIIAPSSQSHAETYQLVTTTFTPFTDPDHPDGGFLVEIARAALKTQGHDARITYYPWPRALKGAEEAQFDGLLSAYYSAERAKRFHFSAPLNRTQMVLIGLKMKYGMMQHYTDFADLRGHMIAVGRKWAYSREFDTSDQLSKITVKDEATGIRLLYSKRIDLFAVNEQQYKSTIRRMSAYDDDETVTLSPAISFNDQHIAVSKKSPNKVEFLKAIDTGLAQIRKNGTYDQIKQKYFSKNGF